MVAAWITPGAPVLNTDNPVCFFTNVASRLLSTELNVNLTRIEIYPTNQYTSSVHRLLQVAANIYDATSTNFYPSRFRPLFTLDPAGNVFICGYEQQTNFIHQNNEMAVGVNPDISTPVNPADLLGLPTGSIIETNIYGVPWIIGAKKGFPNFNEFSMESVFQVARKLQFTRNTNTIPASDFHTNQMYIVSITNFYGLECWNSYLNNSNYTSPYGSGPLDILVRNNLLTTLTVENGFTYANETTNWQIYSQNTWPSNQFVVPLNANDSLFTKAVFVYNNPSPPNSHYFSSTTNYLDNGIAPLPQLGLQIKNQLQLVIVDYSGGTDFGQIVDYVQLDGLTGSRNLNGEIADVNPTGMWATNLLNGTVPEGVVNQFYTSRTGTIIDPEDLGEGTWANTSVPGLPPAIANTAQAEQVYFTAFFSTYNIANYSNGGGFYTLTNLLSSMQAPYTPTRTRVQRLTWQANDPLVHYLANDLVDVADDSNAQHVVDWPANLGLLNNRYMPWGGNPHFPPYPNNPNTANAYNLAIKDPLVSSSDDWNFPVGQSLNPDWLGRVHRGTPWQTIYLKSTDILQEINGTNVWMNWTGDSDINDAAAMAPVRDWHLASLLAALMNTNSLASLFSVNNPDSNAWQGLLNGLIGLTNIPDQFDSILISSNSPQASGIASAIESARSIQPGQFFSDTGSILATPQLAEQSPFLVGVNTNVINDEAYEIIPSQLLALLRADSIGSVVLMDSQPFVQFTGSDGHTYAIQASSDLVNWVSVSTNCPVNGVVSFTNQIMPSANQQFYRSVLLQ
jgi:hypothetical protein